MTCREAALPHEKNSFFLTGVAVHRYSPQTGVTLSDKRPEKFLE